MSDWCLQQIAPWTVDYRQIVDLCKSDADMSWQSVPQAFRFLQAQLPTAGMFNAQQKKLVLTLISDVLARRVVVVTSVDRINNASREVIGVDYLAPYASVDPLQYVCEFMPHPLHEDPRVEQIAPLWQPSAKHRALVVREQVTQQ